MAELGIIAGSGIYEIEGVEIIKEIELKTPFGKPSDKIMIAKIGGKEVAFLPRHGKGHRHSPTVIPVKANAWAFKKLGVRKVLAISAVGSLKEEIKPQHFVVPSQIIDRTKRQSLSLFDEGVVAHVSLADPFCKDLSANLYQTIKSINTVQVHSNETYLCMEGPQFSTRAESNLYRSWGCGIIGMTAIPEAKIFREAEICYSMIALSTDYDCWHDEPVTLEMVLENMGKNVANLKKMLPKIIENISLQPCGCENASQYAIVTDPKRIPNKTKKKLDIFYGKYWK